MDKTKTQLNFVITEIASWTMKTHNPLKEADAHKIVAVEFGPILLIRLLVQ